MQKKVLVISMVAPYDKRKFAGSKTHNYYIKGFEKSKKIDLRLLTFCEEYEYEDAVEDLREYGINAEIIKLKLDRLSKIKRNLAAWSSRINPFDKNGNFTRTYYKTNISCRLKKYKNDGYYPDVVILAWTQVALFLEDVRSIYPNARYVVSEYDVSFQGYQRKAEMRTGLSRILWNNKAKRLLNAETNIAKNCDLVVVQNDKDRNLLVSCGVSGDKIFTMVPYYDDYSNIKRNPDYNQPRIIFYGAMKRPENYECAIRVIEKIMPNRDSDIVFYAIGGSPNEKLVSLANDRVKVTGFVDHIDGFLESCICMVAPLTMGAGIKVKTLEMMSAGVPVITNEIGIEGIPATAGVDYVHCETDEEFAKTINDVHAKTIDVDAISESAIRLIKEDFGLEPSLYSYIRCITNL